MDLALAIIFLWLGAALLFVAFHGLKDLESGAGKPGGVISELQGNIAKSEPTSS